MPRKDDFDPRFSIPDTPGPLDPTIPPPPPPSPLPPAARAPAPEIEDDAGDDETIVDAEYDDLQAADLPPEVMERQHRRLAGVRLSPQTVRLVDSLVEPPNDAAVGQRPGPLAGIHPRQVVEDVVRGILASGVVITGMGPAGPRGGVRGHAPKGNTRKD